jgi:hypothetical protein
MKTKHTAETLKYYLGREVYLNEEFQLTPFSENRIFKKGTYILRGIHEVGACYIEGENSQGDKIYYDMCEPEKLYPILKTAEELTEEDQNFLIAESLKANQSANEDNSYYIMLSLIDKLIDRQLYAEKSGTSPTGYVCPYTKLPCVTPKQFEEGIEL